MPTAATTKQRQQQQHPAGVQPTLLDHEFTADSDVSLSTQGPVLCCFREKRKNRPKISLLLWQGFSWQAFLKNFLESKSREFELD